MTDFITKMFYDQGFFDAVENEEPFLSRPIWRHLIHETKSADDRTRILTAKSFNGGTNPNIIPGIYTQPDVWVDKAEMPATDRLIRFVTRQCRFAHNGAARPVDSLRGNASVWWNIIWCKAATAAGVEVHPTLRACDSDWMKKNAKAIDHVFKNVRQPFIEHLTQQLHALNIDVLGQGGEFIILNQRVVDWEGTRAASGFETAHRRRTNVIKEKLTSAFEDFREFILTLRKGGDRFAMAHFKPVASSKTIVVSAIMMEQETQAKFIAGIIEIAQRHGFVVALTPKPFESGSKTPSDYGFTKQKNGYFFQ